MKILLVTPTHMFSVRDVAMGFANAITQLGHELIVYDWGRIYQSLFSLASGSPSIPPADGLLSQAIMGFMDAVVMEKPELVLVVDGLQMPVARIDRIRELGVKTAIYLTDEPYEVNYSVKVASHYDYVFLNDLSTLAIHRRSANAVYLPVGFDSTVRKEVREIRSDQYDVLFVGVITRERAELFDSISETLSRYKFRVAGPPVLRSEKYGEQWAVPDDSWTLQHMVNQDSGKTVVPLHLTGLYNASRVVVNPHRDSKWLHNVSPDGGACEIRALSPNPRTFEAPACKAFQICSNDRPEVSRMFKPDKEIVLYHSPKNLAEKIEYYLANDDARARIVDRASDKVWGRDTYTHRVKQMLSFIQSSESGGDENAESEEKEGSPVAATAPI